MSIEMTSLHTLLIGSMIGFLAQSSRAENRFGTEIELHGLGHKAIHLCMKGSVYYVMGVVGYPMWARYNREEVSNLHTIASLGVGTGCFIAYLMDDQFTEIHLEKIIKKLQPRIDSSELKVEWVQSVGEMKRQGLKVIYPSGDYIQFASDPHTVEVTMNPQTANQLADKVKFYDKEIYSLAISVGLRPPVMDGLWNGGHIHIDLKEAFGGDPQKFKKFVIDFWSHGELARGILAQDPLSDPYL